MIFQYKKTRIPNHDNDKTDLHDPYTSEISEKNQLPLVYEALLANLLVSQITENAPVVLLFVQVKSKKSPKLPITNLCFPLPRGH